MMNMISGHVPGPIRNEFCEAAGAEGPALRRGPWTGLWNCTDIVPRMTCAELDLPQGSTYAQAVRSLPR